MVKSLVIIRGLLKAMSAHDPLRSLYEFWSLLELPMLDFDSMRLIDGRPYLQSELEQVHCSFCLNQVGFGIDPNNHRDLIGYCFICPYCFHLKHTNFIWKLIFPKNNYYVCKIERLKEVKL